MARRKGKSQHILLIVKFKTYLAEGLVLAMTSAATITPTAAANGRIRLVINRDAHSSFIPSACDVGKKKRDCR
uniref:Uncharacterized protein n=1 Tax=Anopheles coluzzii TaxID=1518534 RepID=A0A8W7PLE4_ANOCL